MKKMSNFDHLQKQADQQIYLLNYILLKFDIYLAYS